MNWLQSHPFPVEAYFERSVVLTYALPVEVLSPLLPKGLTLDTYQDRWGFVAVGMVQTKDLRPKGLPAWMGQSFFLIGYRIFTRYVSSAGKNLRGLYILKSETDSKLMTRLGSVFTHYSYQHTDIEQGQAGEDWYIRSDQSAIAFRYQRQAGEVALPPNSPFPDWKTARRYAGPLPHTFTPWNDRAMLIIRGTRLYWRPRPVVVVEHVFGALSQAPFQDAVLASAFEVTEIPYYWEKGIIDQWR